MPHDDLAVIKTLLPSYVPGSYRPPLQPLGVPNLVWICTNILYRHPDQVHVLPIRLNYRNERNDLDMLDLDPRLWATLVQLYDGLPEKLSTCQIPLNDVHLPLLQDIPCTPRFSLITILSCPTLDDDNIAQLKFLHTLTALDASNASLTPYGLKSLASTLSLHMRGPWPLRILSLRNCKAITSQVSAHLERFPLLSVIDLRGTRCTTPPRDFTGSGQPLLFHPTTLSQSLAHLQEIRPDMHSSSNVFALLIDKLGHTTCSRQSFRGAMPQDNLVVTLSSTSTHLRLDDADAIARRAQAREDFLQHEKNKEAYIERQDATLADFYRGVRPLPKLPPRSTSPPPRSITIPANISTSRMAKGQASVFRTVSTSQSTTVASTIAHQKPSTLTFPRTNQPTKDRPAITNHPSPSQPALSPTISRRPTNVGSTHSEQDPQGSKLQPTWVTRIDEPFMLYRDPPPWSTLADTLSTLRSEEARRKESMKAALVLRNSEFAYVDRTGQKGSRAQRQLETLLTKRTEMRETFGLPKPNPPSAYKAVSNPFKKRAVANGIDASTSNKCLVPISTVPQPVFTQELLNVSAKENKKAKATAPSGPQIPATKKRRSSVPTTATVKRGESRLSEGSFDWQKWGKA